MKPTSRHALLLEFFRTIEVAAANARCVLQVTAPSTIDRSIRRIDRKTGSLRRSRKGARHA